MTGVQTCALPISDGLLTVTVEQQIRSSFNFARQAFGGDISRRIARGVSLSGSYRIQRTELKDLLFEPKREDRINIDRVFPQIRLSSFSSSTIHDTRDDVLDPGLGHYASVNGEIGGRAIGSEVGFAKSFFTAQVFRRLPRVQRAVLATSARLGLAAGFPQLVTSVDESGTPVTTQVRDLPAAERFFAGGDKIGRAHV